MCVEIASANVDKIIVDLGGGSGLTVRPRTASTSTGMEQSMEKNLSDII